MKNGLHGPGNNAFSCSESASAETRGKDDLTAAQWPHCLNYPAVLQKATVSIQHMQGIPRIRHESK